MSRGAFGGGAFRILGERYLQLTTPLYYRTEGLLVKVPKGLVCDGASIPRWAYPLLECSWIQLARPGFAHDALYRIGFMAHQQPSGTPVRLTRAEADDLLWEASLAVGASELDAAKIRFAVGAAGGWSWEQRTVDWRP